jgi:hypothetical protein
VSTLKSIVVTSATLALLSAASAVASEEEHGSKAAPHHEAKEPEVAVVKTYVEAVGMIREHVRAIGHLVEEKKLASVHQEAAVVKKVADQMSPLVAKDDSGVPVDARLGVLKAAKALSAMFGPLDEAGDSGNLEETTKLHATMLEHLAVLEKHAPAKSAQFYCPMHPEVTAGHAGTCSKCGMGLTRKK